jgi:hypothetical protein
MHGYWSFEFVLPRSKRRRLFVLFCSATDPDEDEVCECIAEYCDANLSPDRIYLIAPESEREAIERVVSSSKFQGRIRAVTRHQGTPTAECLFFNTRGDLLNRERQEPDQEEVSMIKRRGLTQLIREKHVLRSAPSSHHFAVPSGGHAQSFFRTGDAMTDGAAIDFIAFCCLPYIPPGVRHIYCDSGTICSVAYAIGILRRRIENTSAFASVSSFESYDGFKTFKFRDMARSIILISFTTTGRLAPKLCKTHHPHVLPESVIHLFALCDMPDFTKVVCDLRYSSDNPDGFNEVRTYSETNCRLCAKRSSLIRISSEQFLPGDIEVKPLILIIRHKPAWLDPFLKRVVGKGFIKANYRSETAKHATSEVFFDMQKLFSHPTMLAIDYYVTRIQWLIDLAIPAMLTRIVYIDGPASKAMAELFAQKIQEKLPLVTLHNFSDLKDRPDDYKQLHGATLVVAAAVASGRSLLSVSQTLRTIQPNGAIIYIIGIVRSPSEEAAKELMMNLIHGEQSRRYGYQLLDSAYLPLVGNLEETCWEEEKELIAELQATCEDVETCNLLDRRMESLRNASSKLTRGMLNDVFWDTRDGTPLKLRPNFAFFNFPQPETTSQADVFFTMAAILHDLRSRRDPDDSLYQHEHVHRVLSPRCFDRFNDGVIQSCLLRAALPPELDYSTNEQLSIAMTQVLDVLLSSDKTDTGEASREFLLALALKRLQVRSNDLQSLKDTYGDGRGDPIAKLLWTKIGEEKHQHPCV